MSGDTRSPITDALETLGLIHYKLEKRDAIHLAVAPVVASEYLSPGSWIRIEEGIAYPCPRNTAHGIVDPFLARGPECDESFWFIMKPREVRSLRHVWEHPDFPNEG
jgi:hypothetical protein